MVDHLDCGPSCFPKGIQSQSPGLDAPSVLPWVCALSIPTTRNGLYLRGDGRECWWAAIGRERARRPHDMVWDGGSLIQLFQSCKRSILGITVFSMQHGGGEEVKPSGLELGQVDTEIKFYAAGFRFSEHAEQIA